MSKNYICKLLDIDNGILLTLQGLTMCHTLNHLVTVVSYKCYIFQLLHNKTKDRQRPGINLNVSKVLT